MDGSTLSSNWKQLQAKLKADKSAATATAVNGSRPQPPPPKPNLSKRKRDEPPRQAYQTKTAPISKKARRDDSTNHHKSRNTTNVKTNLGGRASRSTMNNTTTATATNGTSTAAQPSAQQRPPSTPNSAINAGLAPDVVVGKYLALDCEMVGVGATTPPQAQTSVLARVSLVTYHGVQLYDSYVLPLPAQLPITDYRTPVSGITPACMKVARPFGAVQTQVADLLRGRVLVGHSVQNDLRVLGLGHPKRDVRDTARYAKYRDEVAGGGWPRLRDLASRYLGLGEGEFQGGEHSSVEDARVTMMLFRREKEGIEREVARRYGRSNGGGGGVAVAAPVVRKSGGSSEARASGVAGDQDGNDGDGDLEDGGGGEEEEEEEEDGDGVVGNGLDGSTAPKKKKPKKKKRKKKK